MVDTAELRRLRIDKSRLEKLTDAQEKTIARLEEDLAQIKAQHGECESTISQLLKEQTVDRETILGQSWEIERIIEQLQAVEAANAKAADASLAAGAITQRSPQPYPVQELGPLETLSAACSPSTKIATDTMCTPATEVDNLGIEALPKVRKMPAKKQYQSRCKSRSNPSKKEVPRVTNRDASPKLEDIMAIHTAVTELLLSRIERDNAAVNV